MTQSPRRAHPLTATERKYRPDQLRDDLGRFADEGGGNEDAQGRLPLASKLRGSLPVPNTHDMTSSTDHRSYEVKPSLDIPGDLQPKLQAIGSEYTRATGDVMTVTDGARTPVQQATAMYNNIADHTEPPYTNEAAYNEIKQQYLRGSKNALPRSLVIQHMADVIENQTEKSIFISRHLMAGAIDVRLPRPESQDRDTLISIIRRHGGTVLKEATHLHVQFSR